MNKSVFHHLSYGVYVISAFDAAQGRHTGCIVNSVMQVTSSPPVIAASVNHGNYTNGCIKASGQLAVSILPQDASAGLIGTFGFQSGKDTDKFAAVPYTLRGGLAVPDAAMAFFTGKVIGVTETDTHSLFLIQAQDGDVLAAASPMTYEYYRTVIKGKSPKNAPTYTEEADAPPAAQWVCTVCNYVYQGDAPFQDLPDTYTCPICGVPKSKFEMR